MEADALDTLAESLWCKKGNLPFTYLGLPIGGSPSHLHLWKPIIDRMEKKLSSWKGSLLSLGGRATLIKASLSSLPQYFMSLFPIPVGIADKIIKIQRQFMWCGSAEKKRFMAPVAWSEIEKPKALGGLGIGNLLQHNMALLFKWVWRYLTEPSSLWRNTIKIKFGYGDLFTANELSIPKIGGPWRGICSSIIRHSKGNSFLSKNIRRRVGNGAKILFWHDLWIGSSPLKISHPRLFRISSLPNGVVNSFGFWDGIEWVWSFSWARSLRPRDEAERASLLQTLHQAHLSTSDPDTYIWAPSKSGLFSVKSAAMELATPSLSSNFDAIKGLWRGLVPYRIEIFTWMVLIGRINSKDKLIMRGIIPSSEANCVLCDQQHEDINHLFLHCSLSHLIWSWWLNLWGLQWVFPGSIRMAFEQWKAPSYGPFFRNVWCASFFIIVWSIWKERNARCFNQKSLHPSQIHELILLRLGWWISGWNFSFPYSSADIVRNPKCLMWFPSKVSAAPCSLEDRHPSWIPPPTSKLKWNVDASLGELGTRVAIGGVLRDSNGHFKCLFSSPIPVMDINHAEVLAIHRALKIFTASQHNGNKDLIIESDSMNAVKWCLGEKEGPWNLAFRINFIRNILLASNGITLIYKGRETNYVADSLAKQGLTRLDEFVAWL